MKRANRKAKNGAILVDADLFPQHLAVIPGRARAVGMDLEIQDLCLLYTSPSPRDS